MRGQTPKIVYELPFDGELISKAKVVIKYGNEVLIRKSTKDCHIEDNVLSVSLSREESVKLPDRQRVYVQLEIETPAGDHLVTEPEERYSGWLLDEEELL